MPKSTRLHLPPSERRLRSLPALKREFRLAPLRAQQRAAKLEATILEIELGGSTAPAAADAWSRVAAIERQIASA